MQTIGLPTTLERMISDGTVRPPAEQGMPDVIPDLADDVASLSDLVIAVVLDRRKAPEPKTAKNRVHVDLSSSGPREWWSQHGVYEMAGRRVAIASGASPK